MKNETLYNKTVGILVDAYFNDTLQHGSCVGCAVGNIICPKCNGEGAVEKTIHRGEEGMQIEMDVMVTCTECEGDAGENYNWDGSEFEDDEDTFDCCAECDCHDACRDFGCAIKLGVMRDPLDF